MQQPMEGRDPDSRCAQYMPVENVESIEKYEAGGYHPVQIGDRLGPDGQYYVVHKLGFGGHSTVWLARDERNSRYVAIKIALSTDSVNPVERHTLERIQESTPACSAARDHLPTVLAAFTQSGPNGTHECLAINPGMCSLSASKSASDGVWLFDLDVARSLTAQLIRTVAFLHSQGVVHGDLHPGNVLLQPQDLSSLSVEDLYAEYGSPIREAVVRLDQAPLSKHVPPYVVLPVWLGKPCEDITVQHADALITDFGEAWQPLACSRLTLNTPCVFRPPEAMFAEAERRPIGFAADIWTLGCTIYSIFAQRDLFEGFSPDEDDILAENISALGKPPGDWWEAWGARKQFFNESGEWAVKSPRICDGESRSLATRVGYIQEDRRGNVATEEMADLYDLLESMIRWRPEERISADQLVAGKWMRKWGS
ncbi:hypothetical protein JX265_001318 [Neoarthrinium moseri]|uniref:non-specific serine/threonine protein kinase n=1 Tax=Neoarthrinium moseri TaxID=1658444 RepID=A0A9P9WXT4_9PEZI|nr:uncharacterized protein JN550_010769 [Neoarthrinium moseri]KAI1861699.1 hypothetical protein JN550_010769 [Neoarthrinium moseri]KAI1881078.1 hypothetical protein JX265_001318 [Neoarthrinium moseri]